MSKIFLNIFLIFIDKIDLFIKRKKKIREIIYSGLRNSSSRVYKIEDEKSLKFFTPNFFSRWRVETILTKEKDTIDWIKSFDEESIFWDIGANIGLYSLYSLTLKKKLNVVAFEPSPQNFTILTKNITLNKMSKNITAIPNPLDNMNNNISFLKEKDIEEAGSKSTFDDNTEHNNYSNLYKTICLSIDYLIKNKVLEIPNYIKIDVDGNERRIIEGASNTLNDKNIKSILIESNDANNEKEKIVQFLKIKEFKLYKSTITSQRSGNQNLIFNRN